MSNYYVKTPTTNMRKQPNLKSEIISQGYFSEGVKVLEKTDEWTKIETSIDQFQGWVEKHSLCKRKTPFPSNPSATFAKVNRCKAHVYDKQDTIYGPILTLPFDSLLEIIEPDNIINSRWIKVLLVDGRKGYIQRGDVTLDFALLNCDQICTLSKQFLGLPYTWGGRSGFGYDCSGFVQMLYRQMGVFLPRDSKMQMHWKGFTPLELKHLSPADLIFFGSSVDKICHVGLSLGGNQFIHATVAENSPFIHISSLSDPTWDGSGQFTYRNACQLITPPF